MVWLLLCFLLGAVIGLFLKKHKKLIRGIELTSTILLGVLIFALGVSTGSRADVVHNFPKLGLAGLLLGFGAIAGSLLVVMPASRLFLISKE